MKYGKIVGTGRYLPSKVVTNKDLEQIVETSDDWIYSRTGIKERRIADQDTNYEMSIYAAEDAINSTGINPEEIDLIIVATMTSEYSTPAVACLVQKAIGAKNAMAFDLSAACSGYLFALQTASQYLVNGVFKNALVIGSEKLSHITNWEDRNTCVLFGDGAGAAILIASDEPGIIASDCKSVGEDYACLTSGLRHVKTPFYGPNKEDDFIKMEGREVFEFACTKVPACIEGLLEKAQVSKDDIGYFILHQANTRIIKRVAKMLDQNIDKFYTNMEFYGNTSSASVAIALDEMFKSGKLTGEKVVMAGFGAGLTYGASVIQF